MASGSAEPPCPERERQAPVAAQATAAALGACTGELVTTVLFYPIELVKNRMQATVRGEGGFAYTGLLDGLMQVTRDEGIQGLFQGLRETILRSVVADFATVYFGEFLLFSYRRVGGRNEGVAAVPLRTLGGCASISLTLPLETVATRVICAQPPVGAAATIRTLWKEGGVASFWRGIRVAFVLCLNPALTASAVDWLRGLLFAVLRLRGKLPSGGARPMTWTESSVVAFVAKLLTMSVVYPLVRGKVLLQASDAAGTGIFQVLARIVELEGFGSLYRGFGAQMQKSLLSTALKYAVKERTERQWLSLLSR